MCKYCKNLKRIKDLDEKEYLKTVHSWRQRDYLARKLMSRLLDVLFDDPNLSNYNRCCIVSEAYKFIRSNWIGK